MSNMLTALVTAACLFHASSAQSVSTAVATPSGSAGAAIPSQAPLPPKQSWCPSEIFCAGSLLQTVNLANIYVDPKTIVDKPTNNGSQQVLADFQKLNSGSITEGQILQPRPLANFPENPAFLNNVTDPVLKAWSKTVHGFWNSLIRGTDPSALCANATCESSLIPLNHTFVVPGGRFREQYYWDSFWIVEGLIESELFDIANDTLQNFMDELDTIGFIPNGGRIYYLDRSQPPLFIQMLSRYVQATGDKSILTRALPLAQKEIKWWNDNRSIKVQSPFSNQTQTMYHYFVNNTAPRPESYLTDYLTANGPDIKTPLNDSQKADLYAELASGAESGWDYTVRWFADPTGTNDGLRSLNVRNTIGVDLNSIMYKNQILLAELFGTTNNDTANTLRTAAEALKGGIIDLFWDSNKLAFYDFNLATKARNSIFTAAHFYPLWSGIIPNEMLSGSDKAFGAFASLNLVMNRYNGTFPTTFVDSGLQWDAPNAWPPHQYIILQALRALPSNLTGGALPAPASNQSTFSLIPSGQLGLDESKLPGQTLFINGAQTNATTTGAAADVNKVNGTVVNGGKPSTGGWANLLEIQLANRYMASAFCSWHATGGSIDGVVPKLSPAELNVTLSVNNTGNMFEKFSNLDIDSAGRGGEYTVQAGFGWTNGVVLWVASNYGQQLVLPQCPDLLNLKANGTTQGNAASRSWGNAPRLLSCL
ncbi:glycoside hydrolase family 37 protein, partial [Infundibulicybe gibba]